MIKFLTIFTILCYLCVVNGIENNSMRTFNEGQELEKGTVHYGVLSEEMKELTILNKFGFNSLFYAQYFDASGEAFYFEPREPKCYKSGIVNTITPCPVRREYCDDSTIDGYRIKYHNRGCSLNPVYLERFAEHSGACDKFTDESFTKTKAEECFLGEVLREHCDWDMNKCGTWIMYGDVSPKSTALYNSKTTEVMYGSFNIDCSHIDKNTQETYCHVRSSNSFCPY